MRVDHRRRYVAVAQEFLHGADVLAVLQQVGRERVAERVGAGALGDAGRRYGALQLTLQDGLVQVVTATLAGLWVQVDARGREPPVSG